MTIPYSSSRPFVEYLSTYQIPSTMAGAIEQYRLDEVSRVMEEECLDEDLLRLCYPVRRHTSEFTFFFTPLFPGWDDSLQHAPVSPVVMLAPLPSSVIAAFPQHECQALLYAGCVTRRLLPLSDDDVFRIARLVQAAMCDRTERTFSRISAIRYISHNCIDSPIRIAMSQAPQVWKHTREVYVPDMKTKRQSDFRKLFSLYGSPLGQNEIECPDDSDLVRYASDMRSCLLDRNRHLTFCQRCSERLKYFTQSFQTQEHAHSRVV